MKKIININLSGRAIPIEDSAYELLKEYVDSLTTYFEREEGGDEIVSDLENRIAELFQEKLKKGNHCITDLDVEKMISTMGRPEELEEETSTEPQQKQFDETTEEQSHGQSTSDAKRLTRNENDKLVGGVCSGMANYFGIDPVIIRVIAFILILFYGLGLMAYIILWIVLPGESAAGVHLRKRLYRDTDHRIIGGVASGLAAYFKIDIVIPRIIFVLPLLGVIFTSIFRQAFPFWGFNHFFFPFSVGALPTLVVLYIILWIAVPKAVTQAEKLEMKGEKVDLQSLSNAYKSTEEGDEKKKLSQKDLVTPSDPSMERKAHSGIGKLFGTLVKIFLYFVLGVIIITISAALIGVAGGFLGITALTSVAFPFKSLILASPFQNTLSWPAVILTLGIPVVALIWLLVRLIIGRRSKFRFVGITLFSLWIIGVICAACLMVSVAKDFSTHYAKTEEIKIQQPADRLILKRMMTAEQIDSWRNEGLFLNWFGDHQHWRSGFIQLEADTMKIKSVHLTMEKSRDSNFHVKVIRFSNGRTAGQARHYATSIHYPIQQEDSILYISDRIFLPAASPFRNQHLLLKIFVPEGKTIDIQDNLNEMKEGSFDEMKKMDDSQPSFQVTSVASKYSD